jgi:NADPH:quinone reductase-like Zn-dependent oxidoreductase
MKGVIFEKQGAEPTIAEAETPTPADDQILVKSLYTAMNPM